MHLQFPSTSHVNAGSGFTAPRPGRPTRSSGSSTIVLHQPRNPILRLQMPPEASGEVRSLPIGAMRISKPTTRETLLQQTQDLKTERHQVADALSKLDPDTPTPEQVALTSKRQSLDKEIDQQVHTYQRQYGGQMLKQLIKWRENAHDLLVKEDTATDQKLAVIQEQLEAFVPELEAFFNESTQQLHSQIWNQLTQARQRTHSKARFDRIKAMIDSDRPIIANQLQKDDDQALYALFNQLSQELDNLIPVLTMDGISDQQRHQAREEISTIANKSDKIRQLFETVIHRYKRLESDQLYPHQLPEIEAAVRKARRALDPTLEDQDRRKLIDSLENPAINPDYLLDMSEDDFQLVFTLLSKKPLTEAHKNTLKKNNWQLSDERNLLTQRGHDPVIVICRGNNYRLINSATGVPIGTVDRAGWDRIQHELAKKGLRGASHISRQMIIDDAIQQITTGQQHQARSGQLSDALCTNGSSASALVCPPSSSQPALSEPLRYPRRYFHP